MKKVIALCIAAIVVLSSCTQIPVEELLSPPKLDDEQNAIYEALKSCTSSDIILKYPKSGEYRSAFVVKNIDEEETDEAIVFYQSPNITDGSSLRLNFLDKQDGKWVSVYDFAALGNEVESVSFNDFGNGITDILVTYSIQNSTDLAASVIEYSDGQPTEVYKNRFSYMNVFDADSDGTDEIFLINSETTSAYLLGCNEEGFAVLGSAQLDEKFSQFRVLTVGKASESIPNALFIDYLLADGNFSTDVLSCYDDKLTKILPVNSETVIRRTNSYTPLMAPTDIDNDGNIEIPSMTPFPGYENSAKADQIFSVIWSSVSDNGGAVIEEAHSFINPKNDFLFMIPEKWKNNITPTVSLSDNLTIFSTAKGTEFFRISGSTEQNDEKLMSSGYNFVGKSEKSGVYYYLKPSSRGLVGMDVSELIEHLILL